MHVDGVADEVSCSVLLPESSEEEESPQGGPRDTLVRWDHDRMILLPGSTLHYRYIVTCFMHT